MVIAIIGILTAIGLTALSNSQAKARDAKRRGDINSLATSLSLYLDKNTTYPIADPTLTAGNPKAGPAWLGDATTDLITSFNVAQIATPKAPQLGATPVSKDYWYVTDGAGLSYGLFSEMENTGEWFVQNSKGWAGTVDNSSSLTAIPSASNTECVDTPSGTKTYSVCLSNPQIQ